MKYPYLLSHIRFTDAGTKLALHEGGGMTQDVFASTKEDVKDRYGRRVLLERHEHDVLIFRETMDAENKPNGKFECLHALPASKIAVSEPLDPFLIAPTLPAAPAGSKAVDLTAKKGA
jgi:hypothetical protein